VCRGWLDEGASGLSAVTRSHPVPRRDRLAQGHGGQARSGGRSDPEAARQGQGGPVAGHRSPRRRERVITASGRSCRWCCRSRYPPVPIGMVVPLTFTLTMVESVNAPVPLKPVSKLCPTVAPIANAQRTAAVGAATYTGPLLVHRPAVGWRGQRPRLPADGAARRTCAGAAPRGTRPRPTPSPTWSAWPARSGSRSGSRGETHLARSRPWPAYRGPDSRSAPAAAGSGRWRRGAIAFGVTRYHSFSTSNDSQRYGLSP
jgi:hypothetical protein